MRGLSRVGASTRLLYFDSHRRLLTALGRFLNLRFPGRLWGKELTYVADRPTRLGELTLELGRLFGTVSGVARAWGSGWQGAAKSPKICSDSQVAGNNRPLFTPKVDQYWFKVAHNYEPLALQVITPGRGVDSRVDNCL